MTRRLRLLIETDAGGDPDDEQSLVRFLLYANEWDIEGMIANRPKAREGENRNVERTGLGIVRRLVDAYGACYPNLVRHDPRYPRPDELQKRTVAGYPDTDEAVNQIIAAVDRRDSRPLWYSDWGTLDHRGQRLDEGSGENNLGRALDQVLRERGAKGYARFKRRLRLSSADAFGPHTRQIDPPFALWVDTFRPEVDRRRWYHRFSQLTATAGGFDLERDVRTGHGPLGALYPTNTTHPQKEGDTMTFLYLVPTGMNDPEQPTWGSWAGRYARQDGESERAYYWASAADDWEGSVHRDNALRRWAVALQNDFAARLDWCVRDPADANHPPVPRVAGNLRRSLRPGQRVTLDARASSDPDGDALAFSWNFYPEAGAYRGPLPAIAGSDTALASFVAPEAPGTLPVLLAVTDSGTPPLTRYARVIVTVRG